MKRYVYLALFVASIGWTAPLSWQRNIEYTLGFYDVAISTSVKVFDMSYLSWQVLALRWNPFVYILTFETAVRYFPLQQWGMSWGVFSEKGLHPYVYTGIKVPHTFQALGTPLGIGVMHQWTNISFHGRVYGDFGVAPVFVPGCSFELAVDFRW